MTESVCVDALRAHEAQRCAAMLAADTQALEALLDEGLVYIHSTGARDTRASYLAKLASGAMRYEHVSLDITDIVVRERSAVMSGMMAATVLAGDNKLEIASRYESMWIKSANDWCIVALQSFKAQA